MITKYVPETYIHDFNLEFTYNSNLKSALLSKRDSSRIRISGTSNKVIYSPYLCILNLHKHKKL